jgi:hypothetical protein
MNSFLGSALRVLTRHRLGAIAFGTGAFMLAACQGAGTIPSSISLLANPSAATKLLPGFNVYASDNNPAFNNTIITGIDNNKTFPVIVGDYYNKSAGFPAYEGFQAPLTSTTKNVSIGSSIAEPPTPYPTAGIYIAADTAINKPTGAPNQYAVGFATPFGSSPCNKGLVCGVVYDPNGNNASQVAAPGVGSTRTCSKTYLSGTYLYGTDGSKIQVGYYTDSGCHAHAFEEYSYANLATTKSNPLFVEFKFPWTVVDSMAYGINDYGDVVGAFDTVANGPKTGWIYQDLRYKQIQIGKSTQALAVSSNAVTPTGVASGDVVVGSYQGCTVTSNNCQPHGFIWKNGTSSTIDYPGATGGTVVNDITGDTSTIVGWYVHGIHGYFNGFVEMCTVKSCSTGMDYSRVRTQHLQPETNLPHDSRP